jgi:hypothetical protein
LWRCHDIIDALLAAGVTFNANATIGRQINVMVACCQLALSGLLLIKHCFEV